MSPASTLRLGTRGSQLALTQTGMVADALRTAIPSLTIETIIVQTTGDQRRESLHLIGGQGVFTRELELALLRGEVDVAVHSLKDLPSRLAQGLELGATPPRADVRDVCVSRSGERLAHLPPGSRIGTGSSRRAAQLRRLRPDLEIKDIRGNVDTRLRKLDAGEYEAIILAAAGLERLGLLGRVTEYLPATFLLPAPGQAALGLECRAEDEATLALLNTINDVPTFAAVTAERAFLRAFGTGCQLPIAAFAEVAGGHLRLTGRVLSPDGDIQLESSLEGLAGEAEALGSRAAHDLFAAGASALLVAPLTTQEYPSL